MTLLSKLIYTACCFTIIAVTGPAWSGALPTQVLLENGIHQFQQQHFQESVDWFSQLIELEPFSARSYKYRAAAHMELQDYDQAIQDLTSALNLDPELSGVHNNLGAAWYQKKNYNKAITNYSIEIRQWPGSYSAYFNRAMAREKLGRYDLALDDLASVLRIKPDNDMALCFQAELLETLNQTDKAKDILTRVLAINPGNEYARQIMERLDPPAPPQVEPQPIGKFAVQAGAFHEKENARAMVKRLEAFGFEMETIIMTDGKGRTWFMVRQGPHSQNQALDVCAHLKETTGIEAMVRIHGKL